MTQQPHALFLPFPYDKIQRCNLLEDRRPVVYEKGENGKTTLALPDKVKHLYDGVQVIRLVMK